MKYYLPTTTLNFSNILSSEAVSPARRYTMRTVGFNHFEVCGPNPSPDYVFLYDEVPEWAIDASANDDYPLIVELDGGGIPEASLQALTIPHFRVWALSKTIYLSPKTARFLFRSSDEMRRMLIRVSATMENKCEQLYAEAKRFDVVAAGGKPWPVIMRQILLDWAKNNPYDHADEVNADIASERTSGVDLGVSVGRWYRSCKHASGLGKPSKTTILDTSLDTLGFREQFYRALEYLRIPVKKLLQVIPDEQQASYRAPGRCALSVVKAAEPASQDVRVHELRESVCAFIIKRADVDWHWDGASLVEFCRSLWIDVLNSRLSTEAHFEAYRDAFNKLLRNLQQIEPYSIRGERSPFLQAFATFVIGGKDAHKLARLIAAENVSCPEISLALYGAIVGYTRFPRTLLEGESYEETTSPPPEAVVPAFASLLKKKGLQKRYQDAVLEGRVPPQKIGDWQSKKRFPKKDVVAYIDKALRGDAESTNAIAVPPRREEQFLLLSDKPSEHDDRRGYPVVFIVDKACAPALRQGTTSLQGLSEQKRHALAESVLGFQCDYAPDGYYGRNPKDYERNNANTIDHFMRCLSSIKTKKLNVALTADERDAVLRWLETRYAR